MPALTHRPRRLRALPLEIVVIQIKRSETDGFLFECSVADSCDAVIRELCAIHGLREKLARLADMVADVAAHGPSKPEAERGLDEIAEREGRPVAKGPHYAADPLGNRTGDAPPPGLRDVLLRTAADGAAAASKDHAARGVALTARGLQEKVDNVRGAVAMAWPMGLPAWDPVRLMLEDTGAADGFLAEVSGKDFLDPASATLWWAGKEFFRDATVGDRVGRNEKTKVVARLQTAAGGAPVREPAVSEDERKVRGRGAARAARPREDAPHPSTPPTPAQAMMAWYFKKQEEEKKLADDNEEGYLNAKWADPKALKSSLLGVGDVKAFGGGRK